MSNPQSPARRTQQATPNHSSLNSKSHTPLVPDSEQLKSEPTASLRHLAHVVLRPKPGVLTPAAVLQLQRCYGNRFVVQLMRSATTPIQRMTILSHNSDGSERVLFTHTEEQPVNGKYHNDGYHYELGNNTTAGQEYTRQRIGQQGGALAGQLEDKKGQGQSPSKKREFKDKPKEQAQPDKKRRKVIEDERSADSDDEATVKTKKKPKAPAVDERVKRLRRSRGRNLKRKAKPETDRHLRPYQEALSYDDLKPSKYIRIPHDATTFQVSGTVGMGRGGQPYHNTEQELYDDLETKGAFPSDYDGLIDILDNETELTNKNLAKMALAFIKNGTNLQSVASASTLGPATSTTSSKSAEGDEMLVETEAKRLPPRVHRALSILIQLTQLIESHKTRLPGADKWARASLRRIAAGNSTFEKEFNRTNGNFLPARAAKSGNIRLSGYGGQAWGRAMFGLPSTGKTTTAPPNDKVFDKRVLKTLDDLSSSSEEEQEDVERTRVPLTSVPTTENRPKKVTKKRKRFSDSSSESDSGSDYEDSTTTTKRKPPRKKRRVANKTVREEKRETDTNAEKRTREQDEESEND